MAAPPLSQRSRPGCRGRSCRSLAPPSFDSCEPLLPDLIEQHGGFDVPQAVLGDIAIATFREQAVHVHAGDAMTFWRFNAERLAIEVQVEASRRSVAAAHVVERKLLSQITMWLGLKAVSEPVLA